MPDITLTVPDDLLRQVQHDAIDSGCPAEEQILRIIYGHYTIPAGMRRRLPPARTPPADAFHQALLQLYWTNHRPTMLTLHRETGLSRTTISNTLFRGHLPGWQTVKTIITALGGHPREYHARWYEETQRRRQQRASTK